MARELRHVGVGAGTPLFEEGASCLGFPVVLAGAVRVARGSPGDRSLDLYRVTPGELCVVERAGWTSVSRERIVVLDSRALRAAATGNGADTLPGEMPPA